MWQSLRALKAFCLASSNGVPCYAIHRSATMHQSDELSCMCILNKSAMHGSLWCRVVSSALGGDAKSFLSDVGNVDLFVSSKSDELLVLNVTGKPPIGLSRFS